MDMNDLGARRLRDIVPSNAMSRRAFLGGAITTPFLVSACQERPTRSKTSEPGEFSIPYAGADVRCVFYDKLISGDRSGCLLIVLLHGSGADAMQWVDI